MLYKTFEPNNLSDFTCVGSDCIVSCCNGWRIDIDNTTYKKYINCSDIEWRNRFKSAMVNPLKNEAFKKMRLDQTGNCVFLNDKNLCSIQKKYGADFLSDVCRTYPRATNTIGSRKYKWMYLSCPEVVKSTILNDRVISLKEIKELPVANQLIASANYLSRKHKYGKFFELIQEFIFSVITNKKFFINDRILILAYFFENFKNEKNEHDIKTLVEVFKNIIKTGEIKQILDSTKSDNNFHWSILHDVVTYIELSGENKLFTEFCCKFKNDLYLLDETEDRYINEYCNFRTDFMFPNQQLWENYLVYDMYSFIFPFRSASFWQDFIILSAKNMVFTFLMMGIYKNKIEVGSDEFVKIVALMSRALDSKKVTLADLLFHELDKIGKNTVFSAFNMIKI